MPKTNRQAAEQIAREIQPVLDKLRLSAVILYDEDAAVSEESEESPDLTKSPVPPTKRPRNKKVSKTKKKRSPRNRI